MANLQFTKKNNKNDLINSAIETLQADVLSIESSISTLQFSSTVSLELYEQTINSGDILNLNFNITGIQVGEKVDVMLYDKVPGLMVDYTVSENDKIDVTLYNLTSSTLEYSVLNIDIISNNRTITLVPPNTIEYKTINYIGFGMSVEQEFTIPSYDNTYEEGDIVSLISPTFYVGDYSFIGWYIPAISSQIFDVTDTFSMPSANNLEIYPVIINNVLHTVTYDGGDADSGTPPTTINEFSGTPFFHGNHTLVKSGFIFSGWTTEPNGTGIDYELGNIKFVPTTNITLYPYWTMDT